MPVRFWYAALYRKEKDNMSKSYKKNPGYTLEKSSRTDKRLANKQVRKEANNSEMKFKHSDFKKVPKECYGYKKRWTLEEALENFRSGRNLSNVFKSEDEVIEYWKRCSVRK